MYLNESKLVQRLSIKVMNLMLFNCLGYLPSKKACRLRYERLPSTKKEMVKQGKVIPTTTDESWSSNITCATLSYWSNS